MILLAVMGMSLLAAEKSGNPSLFPPRPGEETRELLIVSHGYHAGLIFRRSELLELAREGGHAGLLQITLRFPEYEWLEIGWGDENFYKNVARLELATVHHAAKALLWAGNASVLHVVGLRIDPTAAFQQSSFARVKVGVAGFANLARALEGSILLDGQHQIADLGRGLYGPSLFFRAEGSFSIFRVCNHWVAELLQAAGVGSNRLLGLLPGGLFLDLEKRSGAALFKS